jgi:putative ABC transport system substrate-binding protein
MNRREFIALTAAGAAAAPLVHPLGARAQQRPKKIPRIGIIDDGPLWGHFRQALREAGYIDGQTIAFEARAANGQPDRLVAAAAELVRLPVDVIATYGTPATSAAKAATTTIPIVAISVGDPVGAGLVKSLAHPGGNVTGNTILASDLGAKRLQLIKEVLPSASRVALFWNSDNVSNMMILENMRNAAPALGLAFTAVEARRVGDFDGAFAALVRERPDAVVFTNDPLHQSHIQKIIAFMFQHGLPGMFQNRDNVAAGGLMSYGARFPDLFRQGATYVQKILHGTKPADLPVQPPERFELAINLKTAKAIGLTVSDSFLLRTDEVIE